VLKRIALAVALLLVLFGGVLVVRTAQLRPQTPLAPPIPRLQLDESALAQRLAEAIRIPTISRTDAPLDAAAFEAFHALLAERFPRVHATLDVERVGGWSLLYRWAGSDTTRAPALLAAHIDVVPVEPGTAPQWQHPPFAGEIAQGFIWGRGALDDKSSLMAQLEAVEQLLARGFAPARTLYFAYGHDEEIGGANGAAQIARRLAERGLRLAFTLDEGSALTQGIIPGIERPVAAIMAGEKGYVTFRLTARAAGGHSSMPPPDGAIARLARALVKLDAQPLPARLTPPVAAMLDRLAPEMSWGARLAIANRDLFEPLLLRTLARGSITNALIRSTQAITVLHAGVKDNVLPSEAHALINYRLLPGDRIADVERHIVATIDDPGIEIRQEDTFGSEAPPLSDPDAPELALIAKTVNEVFPDALVSSGIIMATTDNRHYAQLREQAYYFAPFPYTPDDQPRIHGVDERIAVPAYADMVRFYLRLFENV